MVPHVAAPAGVVEVDRVLTEPGPPSWTARSSRSARPALSSRPASSSAPSCKPSTTTPSPRTRTTAGSCSPHCSPESARTPHDRPPLRLTQPGQLPAPATSDDSLAVLTEAIDALARLCTAYWPGDSAVRCTPWPASPPRPNSSCPRPSTTPATRNSPGPRSASSWAPPPPSQPAATGTIHDQLDKDHVHNSDERAFRPGVSSEGEEPRRPTAVYARVREGALLTAVRVEDRACSRFDWWMPESKS